MRVLASYLFPICIGYGYGLDSGTNVARAYQSKKKKKSFFIPGTAQIRSRYGGLRPGHGRRKKREKNWKTKRFG